MSSFVLLGAIMAIAAVVIWSLLNDDVPMNGKTRWLFAMRDAFGPDTNGQDTAPPAPGRHGPRNPA